MPCFYVNKNDGRMVVDGWPLTGRITWCRDCRKQNQREIVCGFRLRWFSVLRQGDIGERLFIYIQKIKYVYQTWFSQ